MITGTYYVIYSTNSVFKIIDNFYCRLKERWGSFIVEEFDVKDEKYLELFFAKDEKMNCYHDENGFKLDANGEGCFLILGRLMDAMNLDIIVKKQVHGQNSSTTEVYDSKLIGNNLWEYTLVLPDVIEENPFCEFIIDSLISSIENL